MATISTEETKNFCCQHNIRTLGKFFNGSMDTGKRHKNPAYFGTRTMSVDDSKKPCGKAVQHGSRRMMKFGQSRGVNRSKSNQSKLRKL